MSNEGKVFAFFGQFVERLSGSAIVSIYPIAQFFGAPIFGALSDKYGRKRVLTFSLAGTMVDYTLFAIGLMTGNLPLMFVSRAISGFTGGNISIAMSAIADISDPKEKAKNFGLVGMAFGLGFILGPFIGGKLADPSLVSWFTYSTPFFFAALLTAVNIISVAINFKETLRTKVDTPVSFLTGFRNIGKAFRMPGMRIIFIVVFLLTLGFSFFTQFSQVFLIDKFRVTQSQLGDYFAYIGIWIVLAQGILIRPVSSRFSPRQVMNYAPILLGIALFALLVPDKMQYLFFISPFIAIAQGLITPNSTTIISNLAAKDSQGEVMGINQSLQSLALAVTPLIAGVISAIDVRLPIIAAGTITLLAWIAFVLLFKEEKKLFHEV